MLRFLDSLLRRLRMRLFDWRITRALNLQCRGEVRSDGLRLKDLSSTLRIEWWARDIHPWDRNLPSHDDPDARFLNQAITDTEAVLTRLFAALPRVETIAIRVFDPRSRCLIMSGDVQHVDFTLPRPRSTRMWLGQLGITFDNRDNHIHQRHHSQAVETNCT